MSPEVIDITLNGKAKTLPKGTTLAGLIAELELKHQRLAAELNFNIVPQAEYEAKILNAGDHLEIVSFVGGG